MITLKVNNKDYSVDVNPDTPLLWVLRENLGLTGTKFGCGKAQCGACTVHIDGKPARSCVTNVSSVEGKEITTIEGLQEDLRRFLYQAWIAEDAPQCGYCQTGQIMSAAILLHQNLNPTDADIDKAMTGNICRCGTYQRIRRAIHLAAELKREGDRRFVKVPSFAAGSLVPGVFPGPAGGSESKNPSFALNAFVSIGVDDSITIIANHAEMGQGVYTALPMLVAEELDADWSKVRVEAAPIDPVYNHTGPGMQVTGGSTSIRSEWERLRNAGAAARALLVAVAAATWQVDPQTCRTENSQVIDPASGRRLSYGQLAEQASAMKPPPDVALKDPNEFKLIGKPTKRLDTLEKINGTAIFGIDVTVPEALVAVVARPQVFRATVKSCDAGKAKKMAGVRAVELISQGVAVVAASYWQALQAREKLEIDWDEGPLAELDSERQREQYAKLAEQQGVLARKEGDAASAINAASVKLEAVYELPYLAHAPMETLNCVADVRADGCDVWTGTQYQTLGHRAAVEITGLKPEQVKLHSMLLGGGFGRRGMLDSHFVREAVEISKLVKKPVKVIWSREDDIRGGQYRPRAFHSLAAGLSEAGDLTTWRHRIVVQSFMMQTPFQEATAVEGLDSRTVEGAADLPYAVPHILVDWRQAPDDVPTHWWRAVGHSHTAFAVESFIDEVAHAMSKDSYELRMSLLGNHNRHKAALELAAEKAGWGGPLAAGRGRGLAVHMSFGSFVAQVAEVSVSEKGMVKVHRVVCAIDCGPVVNPETIRAQVEGGIVFGLTAALYGEISLEKGRVKQSNFNDYKMLRMNEMPVVEVHLVESTEKMGGVGEPVVPPIAPAVANAIFNATGKRIRRLPIRSEDLKKS